MIYDCRLPDYKNEKVKENVEGTYNDMIVGGGREAYSNQLHMLLDWSSLAYFRQTGSDMVLCKHSEPVLTRHDIFYYFLKPVTHIR